MVDRYVYWLRATAVLQLITAAVHAMSFLREPRLGNESERQLHELMTSYKPDLGPYFHPTTAHIFTALSACFSFLYLLAGLTNWYLSQKNLSQEVLKGVTSINVLVFGGAFLVMLIFTFLPPIALSGLVFISLCFAYATNHIHRIKLPKD